MNYTYIIKMIAYDPDKLSLGVNLIESLSSNLNIHLSKIALPTRKKVYTVIRSPHIDKKSREQFERRQHSRLLKVICSDQEHFSNMVNQLKTRMAPGISIKIKFYNNEAM